ncbi:MAG TPA: hypothetical protein VNA89_16125 [Gemmatimonadaceae bacterium]|nr:hypothetical protein [Gemmatimonadaceae bacterium]
MSDRNKPHNGRDASGNFKVKREDVEDRLADPEGAELIRDDVRLGGAVEDIGAEGGERGARLGRLVEENRADVERVRDRDAG